MSLTLMNHMVLDKLSTFMGFSETKREQFKLVNLKSIYQLQFIKTVGSTTVK
jgi:hypothetical protein